jgi:hypothetical protein
MDLYYDKILGVFFRGFMTQNWAYLCVCAGLGILFLALAWILYRRRHLETAGDFISFRPVKTGFLLIYTLAMGSLVYAFSGALFGRTSSYFFFVVGILIGWFTGWMLLERTVKVFTKTVLAGFAIFAVFMAGSIALTLGDPMGIVSYIPESQSVEFACMYTVSDAYYYTDNYDYGGRYATEEREISEIQAIHRQMIDNGDAADGEYITVGVKYRMKNGKMVSRSYEVPAGSQAAENLRPYFSDLRSVCGVNDWKEVKDNLDSSMVYWYSDEERKNTQLFLAEDRAALLAALEADAEAGLLAQHDYYHSFQDAVASLEITWRVEEQNGYGNIRTEFLTIYADCVNTCAFLEGLEDG